MSFFSCVTLGWCLCSPPVVSTTFHGSGAKSLTPLPPSQKKKEWMKKKYHECILRKETSLLASSHKNIHPHRQTCSYTHTHTHTSTTKVLSLKWTSIRGREGCYHWGQKNTSEAKTVKNMDVDLLQACAVHGLCCNTSRWTTGTQIDLIKDKWPWRDSCCERNKTQRRD